MALLTGEDATILIGSSYETAVTYGLSDLSITIDRGIVEEKLVGTAGNYFTQGAISVKGSLTNCKFAASGNSPFLDSIVDGAVFILSGQIDGSDNLNFYFASCQVTGYNISIGDASTITEASIDWQLLDPKNVTYASQKISD